MGHWRKDAKRKAKYSKKSFPWGHIVHTFKKENHGIEPWRIHICCANVFSYILFSYVCVWIKWRCLHFHCALQNFASIRLAYCIPTESVNTLWSPQCKFRARLNWVNTMLTIRLFISLSDEYTKLQRLQFLRTLCHVSSYTNKSPT